MYRQKRRELDELKKQHDDLQKEIAVLKRPKGSKKGFGLSIHDRLKGAVRKVEQTNSKDKLLNHVRDEVKKREEKHNHAKQLALLESPMQAEINNFILNNESKESLHLNLLYEVICFS